MNTNMSLFVPHMNLTVTKEQVASIFAQFGEIERIDFVYKKTGDKGGHNAAYIRFANWHDTEDNRAFQQKLTTGNNRCQLPYDDKWFWIVLENKKMTKHAELKTPPRKVKFMPPPPPNTPKKIMKRPKKDLVDLKHVVKDLFGEDTTDLVDAKYVRILEKTNQKLVEDNLQLFKELEEKISLMRRMNSFYKMKYAEEGECWGEM